MTGRKGSSTNTEVDSNGYTIKDSGVRKQFKSGMIRDSEDKVLYSLIPLWMLDRFAEHLTKGAKKYKKRNWEKAETPQELDRFIDSAWRHWRALLAGEVEEDHFSALIFNLCGMEHTKKRIGKDWQKKLEEFRMKEGD